MIKVFVDTSGVQTYTINWIKWMKNNFLQRRKLAKWKILWTGDTFCKIKINKSQKCNFKPLSHVVCGFSALSEYFKIRNEVIQSVALVDFCSNRSIYINKKTEVSSFSKKIFFFFFVKYDVFEVNDWFTFWYLECYEWKLSALKTWAFLDLFLCLLIKSPRFRANFIEKII